MQIALKMYRKSSIVDLERDSYDGGSRTLHKMGRKTLEELFDFILERIMQSPSKDRRIIGKDIDYVINFFGVVFYRMIMLELKVFRHEAIKMSKIYLMRKIIEVARNQQRFEISKYMEKCLKCVTYKYRRNKKRSVKQFMKSFELNSINCYNDSLQYILNRFGTDLKESLLLDRLALRIASNYFSISRTTGELHMCDIDPFLDDENFHFISTIVLSTMSILDVASKQIRSFDHNEMDTKTKIFIGKCLMITQKIPLVDIFQHLMGKIELKTPSYLPKQWCNYLIIEEDEFSKRIFSKLKRDVREECFQRIRSLINELRNDESRKTLLNYLDSPKTEINMFYFSEFALIEIAKERRIPICFHIVKTVCVKETIKKDKNYLFVYTYNNGRFEQIQENFIDSTKLAIGIRNIWNDPNNSKCFESEEICIEEAIWESHAYLSPGEKKVDYNYKKSGFLFRSHAYPSTVENEIKFANKLSVANWNPSKIKLNSPKVFEGKLYNQWHWEQAKINDSLKDFAEELKFNSLLDSLAQKVALNYFKLAKISGCLDISQLDPLIGDTCCQVRTAVIVSMPILARASKDIEKFNPDSVNKRTLIYLGKCLMLAQKIPIQDIFENIISTVRQKTPTYIPKEWCEYLGDDGLIRKSGKIFTKIKQDIAIESLNRLDRLLKRMETSKLRKALIKFLASTKRDRTSLGIEMSPLYLTELAMIEVAKAHLIPIAFHVLNARYNDMNETIEVFKWDLVFYIYREDRFEKIPSNRLNRSRLVIGMENIWYEGSEKSLNYGEEFIERLFNVENYIEIWKGHPELSRRMSEVRESFLKHLGPTKQSSLFDFPGSMEYLELKENLTKSPETSSETLDRIKRLSFIFASHFYPSTAEVEINYSNILNEFDWKPINICVKPYRVAENVSLNRRYWEFK